MSLSLVFVRLLVIFGISVRKKKKKFSYRGKMNLMIIKEVGKM